MEIGFESHLGVRGLFRVDAIRPDGTIRELAPWQDNLVTDIGLNTMGGFRQENGPAPDQNSNSYSSTMYCWVGTGSTPPSFADTAPAAYKAHTLTVASSKNTRSNPGDAAHFFGQLQAFQFPVGAAAGNLTEVGLSNGSHAPSTGEKLYMFSRALIKNASGNPITVTVLPDEILQVTYETRHYLDTTARKEFKVMDGATEITVTLAPWGLGYGDVNGWISADYRGLSTYFTDYAWGVATIRGEVTGNYPAIADPASYPERVMGGITNTQTQGQSYSCPIATWGSRSRSFKQILGVNTSPQALPGIAAWYSYGAQHKLQWCGYFSPPINKGADEILTLEWTLTWGRYTP